MTTVTIQPTQHLLGEFTPPGDKSITQRAILFAMIAKGESTLQGILESEDCLATLKACRALGLQYQRVAEDVLVIQGLGKHGLEASPTPLDLGNSGTGARLLLGLLSGQAFESVLIGDESLSTRPMKRVIQPLQSMGATFTDHMGCLPITVQGRPSLSALRYRLPVASAQLKTALMLASLYANDESQITEPQISRNHSECLFKSFSLPLKKKGKTHIISGKQELKACEILIPGDFSSAAFFITAALLAREGELYIRSVGVNATRAGFLELIKRMGAKITCYNLRYFGYEAVADLRIEPSSLQAIKVGRDWVALTIDEYPLLFLLATQAEGVSVFSGLSELRVKECDRLERMKTLLASMGATVHLEGDEMTIVGKTPLTGGRFDCDNDHRIAMTLAISAMVSKAPVEVSQSHSIRTSFPGFVQLAKALGMRIN